MNIQRQTLTGRPEWIIIRGFGAGERVVSPYLVNLALGYDPQQMRAEPAGRPVLTARELEVLKGLLQGRSNKEIGLTLHISTETVKSHVKSIYAKLEVKNRLEAARTAREKHLVE